MAATGINLSYFGAHKTVATEEQAVQLEEMGWVRSLTNTASDTTALNEFPSYLEDYSNNINPSFRGTGIDAMATNSLGYIMAKSGVGMNEEQYALMEATFQQHKLATITTFTSISVVSVLPTTTSISHTTIYILDTADPVATITSESAGIAAGLPVTNITDNYNEWLAFTQV